jgi:hypothetical protein
MGAIFLNPREIKMNLIVPMETSHTRAKKIMRGIMTNAKVSDIRKVISIFKLLFISLAILDN